MHQTRLAQAGFALNHDQAAASIVQERRQHLMQLLHFIIAPQQRGGDARNAARGQRLSPIAGNFENQNRLIKALNMRGAGGLKIKQRPGLLINSRADEDATGPSGRLEARRQVDGFADHRVGGLLRRCQ